MQRENRSVATITFQIFFGMYDKLAGMTVRGAGPAWLLGCFLCCSCAVGKDGYRGCQQRASRT